MPRTTPTEELLQIEAIVAGHPHGAGIAAIEAELEQMNGHKPNRRTLQRRLQKLVAANRLSTEGDSIAWVYKLAFGAVVQATAAVATTVKIADAELYVPVSPKGAAIRDQVRRALMHRRPVGYQREFLQAYQPGTNFYLPESLRRQLHDMGRTPDGERPAGTYAREILGRLSDRASDTWPSRKPWLNQTP